MGNFWIVFFECLDVVFKILFLAGLWILSFVSVVFKASATLFFDSLVKAFDLETVPWNYFRDQPVKSKFVQI